MNKCIHCGKTFKSSKGLYFHVFPKNEDQRKEWLKTIKLDDYPISNWHAICSDHFTIGDDKQCSVSLGKTLWPEAVPKHDPNKLLEINRKLRSINELEENKQRFGDLTVDHFNSSRKDLKKKKCPKYNNKSLRQKLNRLKEKESTLTNLLKDLNEKSIILFKQLMDNMKN